MQKERRSTSLSSFIRLWGILVESHHFHNGLQSYYVSKSRSPASTNCLVWRLASCSTKISINGSYCNWICTGAVWRSLSSTTLPEQNSVRTQTTEVKKKSKNSVMHFPTKNDPFHLSCQFKEGIVLVGHIFFWSCGKNIDIVQHFFLSKAYTS